MNGFFQILGGGIVGMLAAVAAQYAPAMLAPVPAAPVAEIWPTGTMVLTQVAGACPAGWADGGAVVLGSPAPLGAATSGAIAPATVQTPAFLCIKAAP